MRQKKKSKILKMLWSILYKNNGDALSCKKNTENKSSVFIRIKQNKLILLSNCTVWDKKNHGHEKSRS